MYHLRRGCCRLALALAVAGYGGTASAGVTFSMDSGTPTVSLRAYITGPGASHELAASWQQTISDNWNQASTAWSCHNIVFDMDIKFLPGFEDMELYFKESAASNEGVRAAHAFYFSFFLPKIEGWDVYYVPATKPGDIHRPWIQTGELGSGHFGTLNPHENEGTLTHEIGHSYGQDDHYSETYDEDGYATFTALPGWEGNLMGPGSDGLIDERNFEEMVEDFEENFDIDFLPCFTFHADVTALADNAPAHQDRYSTNFDFSVSPRYPIKMEPSLEDATTLDGSGAGSDQNWEILMRGETDFVKYEPVGDLYNIDVKGVIEEDGNYKITLLTHDASAAYERQTGEYARGSILQYLLTIASGKCVIDQQMLSPFTIVLEEAEKGLECTFNINGTGYSSGTIELVITSKQG